MEEKKDNRETSNIPSDEELEELLKTIQELEKERRNKQKKGPKRKMIAIEFGGVYHPNIIVHFLFSLILNLSLSYIIIVLFNFASFSTIYTYILFILLYTVLEEFVRYLITFYLLGYVIKSFGFIFFMAYLLLFIFLDQFVIVDSFAFTNEYHIVAFATIFVIIRYVLGTAIRRNFRNRKLR